MITIGSYQFDGYTGDIIVSKPRVESFTRTDIAIAGAQLLPSAGRPFSIMTWRYTSPSTIEDLKALLDAYIGQVVEIIDGSLIYSGSPFGCDFIVMDVQHKQWTSMIHARGVRGITEIDLSPAARLETTWTLQATPA